LSGKSFNVLGRGWVRILKVLSVSSAWPMVYPPDLGLGECGQPLLLRGHLPHVQLRMGLDLAKCFTASP
jgi:hypothetical protein